MESQGLVLVIEVEPFRGLFVDLFVVEILALEVVNAIVECVRIVAGFEVSLCDSSEEAFANLSEDVGRKFFMVGQRGLYSTWRHGHGMQGLDAGWWDWERRVGPFNGRFV